MYDPNCRITVSGKGVSRESPTQVAIVEAPAVIAVLPFANVSGDPGQEHISDGIAIDIVGQLQRFEVFPVISLNSTFSYKGKPVNVTRGGQDLGADYVVGGTLRRRVDRAGDPGIRDGQGAGTHDRRDEYVRVVFKRTAS